MKVFLLGYMGSGKTTLARPLASALGVRDFDLDLMIEKQEGVTISEIFDNEGESAFRDLEGDTLRRITEREEDFVLATGGGTPCFEENMQYMKDNGITVYLKEKPETILERLSGHQEHRPLLAGSGEEGRLNIIRQGIEDRSEYYELSEVIAQGGESVESLVEKIKDAISHSR